MPYDYKAKQSNVKQLNKYMLSKTLGMFEYTGLPETIPAKELEKILQTKGFAFITEADGKLYAFQCTKSGEQDAYGNQLQVTIANVYLKFNKTLNIDGEGVMFDNDDMSIGLLPLFDKHNSQLVENDINMAMWGFNSRTQKLISAPDDKTKDSAQAYINKIIDGELTVIGDNAMFDGVKVQPTNAGNGYNVQSMIEYHQYIKAGLYNEIGISSQFNMKRERLVSGEVDQNEDALFPYVYNMLKCRLEAVAAINEKYGLNITVDFGSVWKIKQQEIEAELDNEQRNTTDNSENNSGNNSETDITPEITDENENDNGEPARSPATVADVENADEQRNDESNSSEKGEQSESEQNQRAMELQEIIDSSDASEEDKQAARELLAEIMEAENVPDEIK